MCKGYDQEEGIDYGEIFSLIDRIEGVRTLLAYATHKGFKLYQMDVQSSFLNRILEEEVYIDQFEYFIDPNKRNMVYKLHKALYGPKKSHRAWYERLHGYMVRIGFQRSNENNSLYIKEGPQSKIL